MPAASSPRKAGWKRASGARKLIDEVSPRDLNEGQICIPLIADGDNLTIGKLVALFKGRRLSSGL